METSEAKAVIQHLVDAMDGQLTALREQFGDKVDGVDAPTMVVMRGSEQQALKHCLKMLGRYSLEEVERGWVVVDQLHTFAEVHEGSEEAADALMRFLVGKCGHTFVDAERRLSCAADARISRPLGHESSSDRFTASAISTRLCFWRISET